MLEKKAQLKREIQKLHVFLVLFVLVVVVVVLILVFLLCIIGLFILLLLLFLALFTFAQCLPFFRKAVSFCLVICDDDIVKDSAAFHLPQVETDESKVCKFVYSVVVLILWVCNLFGFPHTLVSRV